MSYRHLPLRLRLRPHRPLLLSSPSSAFTTQYSPSPSSELAVCNTWASIARWQKSEVFEKEIFLVHTPQRPSWGGPYNDGSRLASEKSEASTEYKPCRTMGDCASGAQCLSVRAPGAVRRSKVCVRPKKAGESCLTDRECGLACPSSSCQSSGSGGRTCQCSKGLKELSGRCVRKCPSSMEVMDDPDNPRRQVCMPTFASFHLQDDVLLKESRLFDVC